MRRINLFDYLNTSQHTPNTDCELPGVMDESQLNAILADPNRIAELERLDLLDSFREDTFDRLTELAVQLLGARVSLLSIVDEHRQFYKSSARRAEPDSAESEYQQAHACCRYVVGTGEPLIISDASKHPELKEHPGYLEPGVRAYAGFPIHSRSGAVLGSFCVLDTLPREWTEDQLRTLKMLTDLVVDEIRLRETMLELAGERLERTALLESMAEGVVGVDRQGRCTFVNPAAERLLGWREDELQNIPIHQVLHRASPDSVESGASTCPITEAVINGYAVRDDQLTLWHRDGARIPVSLTVRPLQGDREINGAVIVFNDLREQLASDQALQAAQSRLNTLVNEIPAVTFINSSDGSNEPMFISPQIEWLMGYTPQEWLADPFLTSRVVHPEDRDRIFRSRRVAAETGSDFDEEYRMYARDRSLVWVQNRSRVVTDHGGNPMYRMGITTDISKLKQMEAHLEVQAYTDSLTGLYNRAWFVQRLHQIADRSQRNGNACLAVIFLDIDDFKVVNDSLGHQVGDLLLKTIGERVLSVLPDSATVARLGGDEFTIIYEMPGTLQDVRNLAGVILSAIHQPFSHGDRSLLPGASIGIAISDPDEPLDPESLLTGADLAMYDAKHRGKGMISVFEPRMSSSMWDRMTIEVALRRAIANEEFVVHYQPIVDATTGEINALEALVRWQPPGHPIVLPGDFIPVAEQTGQILEIGRWVLRKAATQVAAWRQELNLPDLRLAVNLSPMQTQHPALYDDIVGILAQTGLSAGDLTLEITESRTLMSDESTIQTLEQLRAAGALLAIDDFGTGYSSLGYLKQYRVDTLKIDRSFIQELAEQSEDAAIVKAVVAVAHTLRLIVTAEGVETAEQAEILREIGCHHIQGFHVSGPLPVWEMTEFLKHSFATR